ncbi:hypothetical protein HMPREF9056_00926 [Actinomyces sp. oral taxon 170 str. F0386]|nr:hypothetical protein HMPREF9056_00926 [Actinomyces sp. oral taxon 170 str. F0386]
MWNPWDQPTTRPSWRSCTGPTHLGLGDAAGGDRAFEQMVLARLIEPTSKA